MRARPGIPALVVLASGEGSNFAALADAVLGGGLRVDLAALVCDREGAPCLGKARERGVEAIHLPPAGRPRSAYDGLLADTVARFEPDRILLLGWMRILSMAFLARFPGRVVNLHPALPGRYPGRDAIARAHADALAGRTGSTGVMLHLVPDEGVDSGPLLAAEEVAIGAGESLARLEERMHEAERRLVLGFVRSRYAPARAEGDPECP